MKAFVTETGVSNDPKFIINKQMLDKKRQQVNTLYQAHGVGSIEYETAFDELHTMNMSYMAQQYRRNWGLSPNSKTPYDA